MKDLFGNEVQLPTSKGKKPEGNPLISVFGAGPSGLRCKHCSHCYEKHYSGKYFKCDLRKDTNSASTDHRANWPACGKFEPKI